MSGNFIALLVAASLGQFPQAGPVGPGYGGGYGGGGGGGGGGPGTSQYGGGAVYAAPDSTQAFGTGDPTHPYDFEPNWAHGYFQEIPAYGGYHLFRPYNYKHVMPQSQVSAAWGNAANMPYSHQYFDRVSGKQTVFQGQPSNMARTTSADVNARFAQIDNGSRKNGVRRQGPPQLMPHRSQNVLPAAHLEAR